MTTYFLDQIFHFVFLKVKTTITTIWIAKLMYFYIYIYNQLDIFNYNWKKIFVKFLKTFFSVILFMQYLPNKARSHFLKKISPKREFIYKFFLFLSFTNLTHNSMVSHWRQKLSYLLQILMSGVFGHYF